MNKESQQRQGCYSRSLVLSLQLQVQKLHGLLREASGWREEIMFEVNNQALLTLQSFAGEFQRNHSQILSSPYLVAACSGTALFYGQCGASWSHPRAVGMRYVLGSVLRETEKNRSYEVLSPWGPTGKDAIQEGQCSVLTKLSLLPPHPSVSLELYGEPRDELVL